MTVENEVPVVRYKPYEKRTPDVQYRELLTRLKLHPLIVGRSPQGVTTRTVIGHTMRFDLGNGFPLIVERDLAGGTRSVFRQALGEICAFLNGADTQEKLEQFGCNWWKSWTTSEYLEHCHLPLKPGELGPGSYGPALRRFPTADGGTFDQIQNYLIEQIDELPYLRTHHVTTWIPQYNVRGEGKQRQVAVAPCHGDVYLTIDEQRRELWLTHVQRSADVPVGLVANLIQYGALALMLAQIHRLTARGLAYFIVNAHLYDGEEESQLPQVNEMLTTTPVPLPTVMLDPTVDNLFDFRAEHFTVEDYHPQLGRTRIWTPV